MESNLKLRMDWSSSCLAFRALTLVMDICKVYTLLSGAIFDPLCQASQVMCHAHRHSLLAVVVQSSGRPRVSEP